VPNKVVKNILSQPKSDEERGMWIEIFLEYDLEVKPTKLIKCKGLTKLMAKKIWDTLAINFVLELLDEVDDRKNFFVSGKFKKYSWYNDVVYVLHNLQISLGTTKTCARFLKLKAVKFCILDGYFFWKDSKGILLNCLLEYEAKQIIKEFH